MKTAIFIISHNRADRVETARTLRSAGYTDKLYIVIDDKDEQREKYLERFGDDVLIFDKSFYMKHTDTIMQEKKANSPVYARNYVENMAKQFELDAFGMLDDDIKNLRYRWVDGNVVKSLSITKNLDKILQYYTEYMINSNLSAVSFSNVMLYVGGADGIESRIINNREMYQIHIRNAKFDVEWKSNINNDTITELLCAREGMYLWSLPFVIYDSPKMNTLPGGMKAVYDSMSEYSRAFMATIAVPSVCKPIVVKDEIVIGRNKKAAYPVMISGRYKK